MAFKGSQSAQSFTVQAAETLADEETRNLEKYDCSRTFLKI
jgi:hypothetical protein